MFDPTMSESIGMLHTHIFQINLSNGGLPKLAVREAEVHELGLVGDKQRNLKHHGGPERAVCLYSLERILALQAEGHPIYPGAAGENITLAGVDWEQVRPGARLRLGEQVVLEVTRYTEPCSNIRDLFKDGYFNRIHQERFPGWSRVYARVAHGGRIRVGDAVTVEG